MSNIKLTAEEFNRIAGGLQRLDEIKGSAIQTPTMAAEAKGLIEYLSNAFLTHGPELLGCFYTVRNEYEPMLNMLSTIGERLTHIRGIKLANAMKAQQPASPVEEPSNTIPVGKV